MEEVEQTYSAEGDSGVEVKSKKGWLCLILFLVVVFVSGIVYLSNSFAQPQRISRIIITGNSVINSNDLIKTININKFNSGNKSLLLNEVKRLIEKNPYVDYSYIYQKSSNDIVVEIHEKNPVAIVIDVNGDNYFTSDDGTILPYNTRFSKCDFPLIRGIEPSNLKSRKILKSAIGLLCSICSEKNYDISKSISEIVYNPNEKNFTVMLSESGKEILIGKPANMRSKSESLRILLQNLDTGNDFADAELIDLRWKNQIVVKSKNFVLTPDSLIKKI